MAINVVRCSVLKPGQPEEERLAAAGKFEAVDSEYRRGARPMRIRGRWESAFSLGVFSTLVASGCPSATLSRQSISAVISFRRRVSHVDAGAKRRKG